MLNEDKYIKAFAEMNNTHFNEKEWLVNNFEIYKLTLNWPHNLPPIDRSNLIKGTLREKFNSIYKNLGACRTSASYCGFSGKIAA